LEEKGELKGKSKKEKGKSKKKTLGHGSWVLGYGWRGRI
jgi:hypothetical protein